MEAKNYSEERAKKESGVLTIAFAGALVLIFCLCAFKPPYPPHEAEGFLVDFGFDETGFGTEEPTSVAATPASASQQVQVNDEPVTQDIEETITLPEKKKLPVKTTTPSTTTHTSKNQSTQKEETIDNSQIFTGNKKYEGKGSSEGDKPGTTGNMGKPDGDPNGGYGDGDGIGNNKGGSGMGSDLKGRVLLKKSLTSNSIESGKIVFNITVDQNGYIRTATYERSGSTITDSGTISYIRNQLLNKQWFQSKSDAAETQSGHLTVNISMN